MKSVLDSSALLAVLLNETGGVAASAAIFAGTCMSAVNLCEVASVYSRRHLSQADLQERLDMLPFPIIPVDTALAYQAAALASATAHLGLSLGDRCCLALAKGFGVPAITADRAWRLVARTIGVDVVLVR